MAKYHLKKPHTSFKASTSSTSIELKILPKIQFQDIVLLLEQQAKEYEVIVATLPQYAGDLHWLELEEPIDIVLIVGLDWYIILDYQTQKHQMNTEY